MVKEVKKKQKKKEDGSVLQRDLAICVSPVCNSDYYQLNKTTAPHCTHADSELKQLYSVLPTIIQGKVFTA